MMHEIAMQAAQAVVAQRETILKTAIKNKIGEFERSELIGRVSSVSRLNGEFETLMIDGEPILEWEKEITMKQQGNNLVHSFKYRYL